MRTVSIFSLTLMIVTCLISCKQATNYHPRSVKVIEGDMQNTYFFEYDSLSRLKSWQSDYNDRAHSTVITKFVYGESAIEIFKSEGNHREGGTRYNMSPYKLDRIIKIDGWKPSEIIDPRNQQTLFKFFYKDDLISCAIYYYPSGYNRDSIIYELDQKGNIIREFLYHTNYLKRYEAHPDTVLYEFDDNPNPWHKFIGNANNGCFLSSHARFNNYSYEFDPNTFFSPNNVKQIKDYKGKVFSYIYNENKLPTSIAIDDETTIFSYLNNNEVEPNNKTKAEDEKLQTENSVDLSSLKTSLLQASTNKCKHELGSPDISGMIREFDNGNIHAWIYLNRNVQSGNSNKQHLVVFIKALGHGRGIVEDVQSIDDNENAYYDYGELYVRVQNRGKDIQSNSRSFRSTPQ